MRGSGSDVPVRHQPVLVDEVLELLQPQAGDIVVDATVGAAGHAAAIWQLIQPGGTLVGIDRDPEMLSLARGRLPRSVRLFQGSFRNLREILDKAGIDLADRLLMDLGICTDQLDNPERGFSFQQEGPLDMRMNSAAGKPASHLVNRLREDQLADIFYRYGEERNSRRVARAIVAARKQEPVNTTCQLAEIVCRAMPRRGRRGRLHPATLVFQALRIAVNDELESLRAALAQMPHCLKLGGLVAIISFHSLEDRIVKHCFRAKEIWQPITRKPVRPAPEEIRSNPRARSARLRVARLRPECA